MPRSATRKAKFSVVRGFARGEKESLRSHGRRKGQLGAQPLLCLGCRESTSEFRCAGCGRPCHVKCVCICERPVAADAPVAATRESLMRSVKRIPAEIVRPNPRGEVCENMCAGCPFRPDGSGYAADHPDFPNIKRSVEMGLPFYCHETVLMDPRTKLSPDAEGEADVGLGVQEHFLGCRGAHEHRMKVWAERVEEHLGAFAKPGKAEVFLCEKMEKK